MFKIDFVLLVLFFLSSTHAANQCKLTALKCLQYNPGLFKLEKCFVKAISRNLGKFNIAGTLTRPVSAPLHVIYAFSLQKEIFERKLQAQLVVFYRYGTIFREVIKGPKLEWCSALKNMKNNAFVMLFYDLLYEKAPQAFQDCPYMYCKYSFSDYKI